VAALVNIVMLLLNSVTSFTFRVGYVDS